jgi:integrase
LIGTARRRLARRHVDLEGRARRQVPSGSLQKLIDAYLDSTEFRDELAERTKTDYHKLITRIRVKFGSMPLAAVEDRRARGVFKAWRDEIAENAPRQADYLWTVLARILSIAKDRGLIALNACEKGGRVYKANRAEIIWTAADIETFCAQASPQLQFALLVALWTGQRQGDLLRLTWSAYDGTRIRLRQSKGGRRVTIPVSKRLKIVLDNAKQAGRKAATILCNSRGKPWTEDGFRASWRTAYVNSGLPDDLHFHDLRGTAVTRLALAGCTVPEVAAITGHSLRDVEAILEAHYLGGRIQLAEAAIEKLDSAYGA